MNNRSIRDDPLLRIIGIFLPAGTSALLLSIAHIQPMMWFISLLALVPYLWKLKRSDLPGSVVLGTTLAVCFSFVVFIDEIRISPAAFAFKTIILISIFSIFGIAVNRIKRYIGFYPIFIASLWIPLEYFLIRHAGIGAILDFSASGSSGLIRFASLFGILTISFFIMLINSAILLLIECARRIRFSVIGLIFSNTGILFRRFENIGLTKRWYSLPNLRAPPSFSSSV